MMLKSLGSLDVPSNKETQVIHSFKWKKSWVTDHVSVAQGSPRCSSSLMELRVSPGRKELSGIQFNIVGAKLGNTEMPWVAEEPWTLAGIAGEAQWDIDGVKDVKCP